MGNCKKVKFNGSYNDGSLPIYDTLRMHIVPRQSGSTSYNNSCILQVNSAYKAEVVGSGGFGHNATDQDNTPYTSEDVTRTDTYLYLFSNGTYTVNFTNKYSFKKIKRYGSAFTQKTPWCPDADDMRYMTSLEEIDIHTTGFSGNVDVFSLLTNLIYLDARDNTIVGNIKELGKLVSCTTIMLSGNNGLYGELNDLITALATNGASGSFSFDFRNTQVTYNGQAITDTITVTI